MTETDIQRYAREVAAVDLDHERNRYTTTLEYRLAHEVVRLDNTVIALSEESRMMRKEFAEVRTERDALAAVVEVLRQYYLMQANDDQLYDAFCVWRENPFTGKISA